MAGEASIWQQDEPETYFHALDRALAACPDRVFLEFDGRTFTYGQIDRLSTRMAHALAALGVKRGQTVLTLLDSHEDSVVAWFAINKLAAIWVPVNTAYRGEFLRHQIADSGTHLVICENHYLDRIAAIAGQLTDVKRVLCRGAFNGTIDCIIPIAPLDDHRGSNDSPTTEVVRPEDTACLIYTSGTTGRSKGCIVSHNYICNGARQQNMSVPPLPGEITWTCLPLFHIAGAGSVVLATLMAQATAAYGAQFSVSAFWHEIERTGATTAMLMASMFPLLAQAPDNEAMLRCRGRLRAVTGVPLTAPVRKIWHERFGVPMMNSFGYGQTEASKLSTWIWGEPLPPLASAGRPSVDFEMMIADDSGRPLPAGVAGEILIRPRRPGIMFGGYWGRPQDTVTVWRDLWLHTGDIGKFDDDGYFYFVDRKKDYVRSRGENISSIEVEAALMAHPAISEAAFHVVPNGGGGEDDLKVTLVLKAGESISEEQFCRWTIEYLPYFAVPRYFEFRTALPKTLTGRVQKHQLRDEGCTPATWDARAAGIIVKRR